MRWVIYLLVLQLGTSGPMAAEAKGGGGRGDGGSAVTDSRRPPGLSRQDNMPPGLEKKDKTPSGWSKGKKTGWKKSK